MKVINIREIKEEDLPWIVLSDDRRGFLGFLIKHRGGQYSHIMELHKSGFFASQNFNGFREIPIEKYLKPRYLLKVWRYKDLSEEKKKKWLEEIQKDLSANWFKRHYDLLGIFGQAIGIRWLQNPWAKYCSERVAYRLRRVVKMILPFRRTPSELDAIFKRNDRMEVVGYALVD